MQFLKKVFLSGFLICTAILTAASEKESEHRYSALQALNQIRSEADFEELRSILKVMKKWYATEEVNPYPDHYDVKDVDHGYVQSIMSVNNLVQLAETHPEQAGNLLLTAYYTKLLHPPIYLRLAEYHLTQGHPEIAKKYWDRFLELTPFNVLPGQLETFHQALNLALYNAGSGPLHDVNTILGYRLDIDPTLLEVDPDKLEKDHGVKDLLPYYIYHAVSLRLSARAKGAYFLNKALKQDKNNPASVLAAAQYEKENLKKKSHKYFEILTRAGDQENRGPHYLLQAARMAGLKEKAAAYNLLIDRYPMFPDGYRGLSYMEKAQIEKIIKEKADGYSQNHLVYSFARLPLQKHGLTFNFLSEALRKKPDDLYYLQAMMAFAKQGNEVEALKQYEDAFYEAVLKAYLKALSQQDVFEACTALMAPWHALFSEGVTSKTEKRWVDLIMLGLAFRAMVQPEGPLLEKPLVSLNQLTRIAYIQEMLGDYYFQENKMTAAIRCYSDAMDLARKAGKERPWVEPKIQNAKAERAKAIGQVTGLIAVNVLSNMVFNSGNQVPSYYFWSSPKEDLEDPIKNIANTNHTACLGVHPSTLKPLKDVTAQKTNNPHLEIVEHLVDLNSTIEKLQQ